MNRTGTVFILSGHWLIGNKNRNGFIFVIIGCLFWAVFGWERSFTSITGVSIISVVVNARDWVHWTDKSVTPSM